MGLLESCPTCKNPTSENSTTCPKCGEPLEKGWAEKLRTLREEKENSERVKKEKDEKAAKKKSKRYFWIGGILILGFVLGA